MNLGANTKCLTVFQRLDSKLINHEYLLKLFSKNNKKVLGVVRGTFYPMSYSLYFIISDDLRTSSWFTSFTRFSGDVLMVFSCSAVERLQRRIKISDTMRCTWILLVLMWVLTHAVMDAIWMPSTEMHVIDLCQYPVEYPGNILLNRRAHVKIQRNVNLLFFCCSLIY